MGSKDMFLWTNTPGWKCGIATSSVIVPNSAGARSLLTEWWNFSRIYRGTWEFEQGGLKKLLRTGPRDDLMARIGVINEDIHMRPHPQKLMDHACFKRKFSGCARAAWGSNNGS